MAFISFVLLPSIKHTRQDDSNFFLTPLTAKNVAKAGNKTGNKAMMNCTAFKLVLNARKRMEKYTTVSLRHETSFEIKCINNTTIPEKMS